MTAFSDDDLTAEILRAGAPSSTSGPAPSDAAIAAWAEGRLDAERAAIVEAWLASHDDARAEAFALRDELRASAGEHDRAHAATAGGRQGAAGATVVSLEAARARTFRWAPFATAAAVLLAIGLLTLGTGPHAPALLDSDARLVAAAGTLAREAPELFAGFRPLDDAERAAAVDDANRAGLTILEPAGRTLDRAPRLRWSAVGRGATYEVVVASGDGAVLGRFPTTATELDLEEGSARLEPGRAYVLEVTATGPLGKTTATKAFDVADAATTTALASGRTAARRILGDDLGDLAFAHAATRKGFLVDAKRAAAAYVARHPTDAAARELDESLRRRLGWPASKGAGAR